jgi:hypothetical protein
MLVSRLFLIRHYNLCLLLINIGQNDGRYSCCHVGRVNMEQLLLVEHYIKKVEKSAVWEPREKTSVF